MNRSLTEPAARAGRGVEVIIGLGEDPERAARRICARTAAPLVVDLVLEGSALVEHAPTRLPDLFAGAPALCAVALSPSGGELVVRGRTPSGGWEQRIAVPPTAAGDGNGAVVALFGREEVEDLEMRLCAGEPASRSIARSSARARLPDRHAPDLVDRGQRGAVGRSQAPTRKQRMPQELPFGVSVDGLGLRGAPAPAGMPMQTMSIARERGGFAGANAFAPPPPSSPSRPSPAKAQKDGGVFGAVKEYFKRESSVEQDEGEAASIVGESTPAFEPAALAGRITRKKDKELIVEIDVSDELDWIVEDEAWLDDEDGGTTRATVDRARTTAAQRIGGGHSIRLVLTLDHEPGAAPIRVRIGALEIAV